MQYATHPRLHIRDARDAHIVFEAVRQGLLPPVTRRLNESERTTYIRSGSIFVWEESDDDAGLKRWTDGKVWTQSRMREPFLFYDEKSLENTKPAGGKTHTFRFVDGSTRGGPSSPILSHYDRSNGHQNPGGLVKQAYSAYVSLSRNHRPRKWHLTAYLTWSDLPTLPTVDQDHILRKVSVPEGIYITGKSRSKGDDSSESDGRGSHSPVVSPTSPSSYLSSSTHGLPLNNGYGYHIERPNSAATTSRSSSSSFSRVLPSPHPQYSPRIAEDQRIIHMLNARHIS